MPAPNLTVDEIVAYLSRSQLPTVVVEGKDDMRIYGWAEARVGNTKAYVLATGGRNTLLAVYQRRNEFANLPVAFVADRDLWLFSEIPADYHDVIWTQGYSIENDLYTGAELEDLLDAHEVDEHQQVLYAIIEWFAFEVEEFLAGRVAEVDRSCDEIVPPGETKMDEGFSTRRGFRAPDSELIQQTTMPTNFHQKLIDLLKDDNRLLDEEGELITAAIHRRARQLDHDLVRLLLSDDEIKAEFFEEIDGHWIFNAHAFTNYLSSKNFLANSYTRFRNKIGLNIGNKYLRERGEVSLVWPYKDCVLEGGQTREEEKRKEIFFNEILAQDEINRLFDPKVLTNWKRYTVDGEENRTEIQRDENGVIRENLIIKGNNLVALTHAQRSVPRKN